jgi:hypothetical protein
VTEVCPHCGAEDFLICAYCTAPIDPPPEALRVAAQAALDELGVPDDTYPAPVANAVAILRAALEPQP